jgi:hypothetical protein
MSQKISWRLCPVIHTAVSVPGHTWRSLESEILNSESRPRYLLTFNSEFDRADKTPNDLRAGFVFEILQPTFASLLMHLLRRKWEKWWVQLVLGRSMQLDCTRLLSIYAAIRAKSDSNSGKARLTCQCVSDVWYAYSLNVPSCKLGAVLRKKAAEWYLVPHYGYINVVEGKLFNHLLN